MEPEQTFTALLQRFGAQGEKTGWTYLVIPKAVTDTLKPGQKTGFRVTGRLDDYAIRQVALIPMGQTDEWDGAFIMAINATMRKALRKEAGATVTAALEADDEPLAQSDELMTCLADDPTALVFFQSLTPGHQRYYSRWIDEAKSLPTKTRRITQAVQGLAMGLGYSDMIRYFRDRNG